VASHAEHYARIVADLAVKRRLIAAGLGIVQAGYDLGAEAGESLSAAEQAVFAIAEERGAGEVVAIADVLASAMADFSSDGGGKHFARGIETGLRDVTELLGGFRPQELYILAARPSQGKTSLALNFAEHIALADAQGVLFVSLEMSKLELAGRLLCSNGRVNSHRMRGGYLNALDRARLVEASNRLGMAKLWIDDTPQRSVSEIAAEARRLKRKHDLKLLVIDYLQLVRPDNPRDNRQEQVAMIARRLKCLARELSVPVLCLAQLNRQSEVSKDSEPQLHHLRESGAIEQDADVVMFIWRKDDRDSDGQGNGQPAVLKVAKSRNGPTGRVGLAWLPDFTRFEGQIDDRGDAWGGYDGRAAASGQVQAEVF
jgi:replicative DNA helicase